MPSFSANPITPSPGPTTVNLSGTFTPLAGLITDVTSILKACPVDVASAAFVRSARELTGRSRWLRGLIPTFPLTPTVQQYTFTNPQAIQLEIIGVDAVSISDPSGTWHNLQVSYGPDSIDLNTAPNIPVRYAYIDEGQFMTDPAPDKAYPCKVKLVFQVALNATALPPDLIAKFNRVIEAGALSFLYSMRGESWYDPNESERHGARFESGVNAAKAWVQKGYQEGSRRAQGRAFLAS